MATRSLIGKLENKSVTYIYCHFDGYPEWVGFCLANHYNKKRKINALIHKGNVLSLGKKLKHYMGSASTSFSNDFDFYELESEDTYGSKEWLKKHWDDIEFVYLHKEDGWYYKGWDGSVWHKIN